MKDALKNIKDVMDIISNGVSVWKDLKEISFPTMCPYMDMKAEFDTVNKKLILMFQTEENLIIRDLLSANKALSDYLNSNTLNAENAMILRTKYSQNIGLPLNGKSGSYDNSTLVAYSYAGLIIIAKEMKESSRLLERYLHRIYEADYCIAKHLFPTWGEEYYDPIILEYRHWEDRVLCQLKNSTNCFLIKELCYLISFYDISFTVNDWKDHAQTFKEKAIGDILNKMIGPINLTPGTVSKFIFFIETRIQPNQLTLAFITRIINKRILDSIIQKSKLSTYEEKKQKLISNLTATDYLSKRNIN